MDSSLETERLAKNLMQRFVEDDKATDATLIETHISWLMLSGSCAYKLKKPVNFGFVDFSTLEKRKFYCEEELRLNLRTAPDIYLAVVPVSGNQDNPRLGDPIDPFEYVVKMKRFEPNSLLLDKVTQGKLTTEMLTGLAETISDFHEKISQDPEHNKLEYGSPEQVMGPVGRNIIQIREIIEDEQVKSRLDRLANWSENQFQELMPLILQRRLEGFVRECHGDLHLGNIFYRDEECVLFDCIEFNPNLRWIDTANDIAFTIMDLESHLRSDLSHQLINEYLELTGDYEALKLMPFYLVYRALVRAKVNALRSRQPHVDGEKSLKECYGYIDMAGNYTKPLHPSMTIMCGLSGTGKTTIARKLVAQTGAIQLRSDIERKRLFDLNPGDSSRDKGIDIYTDSASLQTFSRLKELSQTIIEAGYPVIVDATFIKSDLREAFRIVAEKRNIPFSIVYTTSSSLAVRERLSARKGDASEAGYIQYQDQMKAFDEFSDKEMQQVITIDTDENEGEEGIVKAAMWIRSFSNT